MIRMRFTVGWLTFILLTRISLAAVVLDSQNSTVTWGSTAWSSRISSTDLINNGQSTLSNYQAPNGDLGSPSAGMNDGTSTYANLSDNTFYASATLPIVATYNLDTSVNTLGYNISSIETFMGWHEHSLQQANQIYTVELSAVGSAGYTLLTTVNYTPFSNEDGSYHYSHVEVSEDTTGILATGIDSIRFTFSSPGSGGSTPGTVIRELDVHGSPTGNAVPEPASCILLAAAGVILYVFRRNRNWDRCDSREM